MEGRCFVLQLRPVTPRQRTQPVETIPWRPDTAASRIRFAGSSTTPTSERFFFVPNLLRNQLFAEHVYRNERPGITRSSTHHSIRISGGRPIQFLILL